MTTSGPGEFAVVVIADVVIDLDGGVVRLDDAGSAAIDAAGIPPTPGEPNSRLSDN